MKSTTQNNTPCGYLSWSQFWLYHSDKEHKGYIRRYIYGEKIQTQAMKFGGDFAKLLETGEESEDPGIDLVKNMMPEYPEREYEMRIDCNGVPLLCKFDGYDPEKNILGEFKTGKFWSQSDADKHGQLTFYALAIYLKTKKIPKIFLTSAETRRENFQIEFTGAVATYETKRTMGQILAMAGEIKETWKGIQKITAREYKKII